MVLTVLHVPSPLDSGSREGVHGLRVLAQGFHTYPEKMVPLWLLGFSRCRARKAQLEGFDGLAPGKWRKTRSDCLECAEFARQRTGAGGLSVLPPRFRVALKLLSSSCPGHY